MAVECDAYCFNLLQGVLNGTYTLQEFIEYISNKIENNKIKNYLDYYLAETQELEDVYYLEEQICSPHFSYQFGFTKHMEPIIYKYFIKKNIKSGNYCLYISIPKGHCMHGVEHTQIPHSIYMYNAEYKQFNNYIYSNIDDEDSSRWVFGLEYSEINILTPSSIFENYKLNSDKLLDMIIITKKKIQEDVDKYTKMLAILNL